MLLFPRHTSRRLCTLTLACAMLATPVFASQQSDTDVIGLDSNVQSSYASYQESVRQHYTQKLILAGYSFEETVFLLDTLPSYRLPALLLYSYSPAVVEYVRQPHFTDTKLDRYLSYGVKCSDLTPAAVVTQVNIGLDRTFYTSVQLVKEPEQINVLVNKYNYLSSKFVPQLVSMSSKYATYGGASMHPEAYQWFTKMVDDAAEQGLWLRCVSAYRSHSYQNTLYTRYVKNNGQKLADTFSARPGYSEHQTGLAVDINTASTSAHFENTAQYKWLLENAWKYGFILRYPQGKENITGFRFEPWHYRYVGLEAAKAIHNSGLTWEEYHMGPPLDMQTPVQEPATEPEAQISNAEANPKPEQQVPSSETTSEPEQQIPSSETTSEPEQQIPSSETTSEPEQQIPSSETTSEPEQQVSSSETTSEPEQHKPQTSNAEPNAQQQQQTPVPESQTDTDTSESQTSDPKLKKDSVDSSDEMSVPPIQMEQTPDTQKENEVPPRPTSQPKIPGFGANKPAMRL